MGRVGYGGFHQKGILNLVFSIFINIVETYLFIQISFFFL
jgi:hypothetical protein